MKIGKSESSDSVAVDRDGVVSGSIVGRVESALICCEEWDADSGASAMMSNNKEGM